MLHHLVVILFLADTVADAWREHTNVMTARQQIALIDQALQIYWLDNGQWPFTLADLLVKDDHGNGPILSSRDALIDPWGRQFLYERSGVKENGRRPGVWTTTPKKEEIANWQQEPKFRLPKEKVKLDKLAARAQIEIVTRAVDLFYLHNKKFPETLKELTETKPALLDKALLRDPWDHEICYDRVGPRNMGVRPDIWCVPPGAGLDPGQIGNWDKKPKFDLLQAQRQIDRLTAQTQIDLLTRAVKAYADKNGVFPKDLDALTKGKTPLLKKEALLDPWGKAYLYEREGSRNRGKRPDIYCEPPDAVTDDQWIGNWPARKQKKAAGQTR